MRRILKIFEVLGLRPPKNASSRGELAGKLKYFFYSAQFLRTTVQSSRHFETADFTSAETSSDFLVEFDRNFREKFFKSKLFGILRFFQGKVQNVHSKFETSRSNLLCRHFCATSE
jgi:hypothetical protein